MKSVFLLLTVTDVDGWVIWIRQDDHKLYTRVPVLGGFVFPGVVQVQRGVLDMVSKREEENSPMVISEPYFSPSRFQKCLYYSPR